MHDHGTRQQVSEDFHHKRVITDYGQKYCNMYDLLYGIMLLTGLIFIIALVFSQVKS